MQVCLFMYVIFTYEICKWIFDIYSLNGQQWECLCHCPYAGYMDPEKNADWS